MTPRELAAERSRALHLAVAQRVEANPALVDEARERVQAWLESGEVARPYAETWRELLALPLPELLAALGERSPRMHELRQVSPFAGVLDPRSRWRILREVRDQAAP